MAVASAVGASLLVIDADVVVPVGVHESVVAVAERGSVKDLLAGAGGLQHSWASLKSGWAAVSIAAVVVPIAVIAISAPVFGCFGLTELLRSCIDFLEDDGLRDGGGEDGKANEFHCERVCLLFNWF